MGTVWRLLRALDDVLETIVFGFFRFARARWRLFTISLVVLGLSGYSYCGFLFPPIDVRSSLPEGVPPYCSTWTQDSGFKLVELMVKDGQIEPGQRARLAKILEKNRDTLDRAVALNSGSDLVRHTRTPWFRSLKELQRMLVARGVFEIQDKHDVAGVQDLVAAGRMGRSIAHGAETECTMVHFRIGLAMERESLETLIRQARAGQLGARALAIVQLDLRRRPSQTETLAAVLRDSGRRYRRSMEKFGWGISDRKDLACAFLPVSDSARHEAAIEVGRRIASRLEELAQLAEQAKSFPDGGSEFRDTWMMLPIRDDWRVLPEVIMSILFRDRGIDLVTRLEWESSDINPDAYGDNGLVAIREFLELREAMARQLWQLCGGTPAATPPSVI